MFHPYPVKTGTWVILENCHLVPEWLSILESICEGFDEETASPDFRLWMTSVTTTNFPVPILQNCIKVALEEPLNVKENLLRSQMCSKQDIAKYNDSGSMYKKMMFSFSIFHAIINERVHFKEVGWNQDDVFSKKNLKLSLSYLFNSLKENESVSLKAISYLTSECIYASGMEDDLDGRTLETIFRKFCCQQLVDTDGKSFDGNNVYTVKPFETFDGMLEYVNSLPSETRQELLGMQESVADDRNRKDTNKLLSNLMLTQNLSVQSKLLSDNESILKRVMEITEKLPGTFQIPDFGEDMYKSMNIILCQQLDSCNKLISACQEAMTQTQEAIMGTTVMNENVENILDHVKKNKVPQKFKVTIVFLYYHTYY